MKKITLLSGLLQLAFWGTCRLAAETTAFRFAVTGCAHFGVCDVKSYETTIEGLRLESPAFVLFAGGMVDPTGAVSAEALWKDFDAATARLGVPTYNVASYCRLSPFTISPDAAADMEKNFAGRYGRGYFSFEHRNNLFIGLDAGRFAKDAAGPPEDDAQVRFLREKLSAAGRYANVFVVMNYPVGLKKNRRLKDAWFDGFHSMIRGKVKYVFLAGSHALDSAKVDEVVYVSFGNPPCDRTGKNEEDKNVELSRHFLIVDVEKKNVRINLVSLLGRGDTVSIENKPGKGNLSRVIESAMLSPERSGLLPPEAILPPLNIRPDSRILDLGAGAGLFTFRFAEAARNGKVYATDIDPAMIEALKNGTKSGGYENVFPVLVGRGFDDFYGRNVFDIVFVSEVYHFFPRPAEFFAKLRPSLAKGSGRVYIIHFKNVYPFTELEFGNFKEVFRALAARQGGSPVFNRLEKGNQDFIRSPQRGEVPSGVRGSFVSNINSMLLDRKLFSELSAYYADKMESGRAMVFSRILPEAQVKLATWLIVELERSGVFGDDKKILSVAEERQLHELNKMLLGAVLGLDGDKIEFLRGRSQPLYADGDSIIAAMGAAGYRLVKAHDVLPYYHFLEFE